jgi:hypothetical protein
MFCNYRDFDVYYSVGMIFLVAVNLFGTLANGFVLFVMFRTKIIRENSTNILIFATLIVEFVYPFLIVTTPVKT